MTDLQGKKILFFCPAFFQYENKIADKMRDLGASVDMYDVRSVKGAFARSLLKVIPSIFWGKNQLYYNNIIKNNEKNKYDLILIVKCDMTPVNILKKLKELNPHAKLCLYLWDSVDNIPGITKKFRYFDTIHSFDPGDCEKFKELKFRPLFFADQFKALSSETEKYKYDICFLGTIHSDRYKIIQQIQKIANESNLKCYWFLYLQSRFIFYLYKLFKKEYRHSSMEAFSFKKMSSSEIAKIVNESRIVLDVQHPRQTGLTMRTIEMLGMGKKIVTTNKTVINYDFYNKNNIAVIDRNNIEIQPEFLEIPYFPLDKKTYEKYSLKNWVLEVLS